MKPLKKLFTVLALAGISQLAAGANPLSVHVLNLQDGLPSPQVKVTLERQDGPQWTQLASGETDGNGRIPALFPENAPFAKGVYRVTFKTGEWYAARHTESFFQEVPVIFKADGVAPHTHIPLLISPFGFSTYRGN